MLIEDRKWLIYYIVINSITLNLLDYNISNLIIVFWLSINAFLLSLKIIITNSFVKKLKWIISIISFTIAYLVFWFGESESIDNNDLEIKKDINILIKTDNQSKFYNDLSYLKTSVSKTCRFKYFKKGDKIYLKRLSNKKIENNREYELRFILSDCMRVDNGFYLNKYSITNKSHSLYQFVSNHHHSRDFFEEDFNRFSWSIFTGESSILSEYQKEYFKRTGTAHIFAVSGLHMGFVFLLSKLLLIFINNRILRSLLTLFLCFIYGIFVGFPDSTIRAFLMVALYEFTILIKTKTNIIYIFCMVFSLVLLFNGSLFSISFQLSFTTVLFILFVIKENKLKLFSFLISQRIFSYFMICLSASCGSFFLVLDKFGYISFFSFIVNFFINPLILIAFIFSIVNIITFFYLESDIIFFFMDFLYSNLLNFIKYFYELEVSILKERLFVNIPDFLHLFIFLSILYLYFTIPPKGFSLIFIISYFLLTFFAGVLLIM